MSNPRRPSLLWRAFVVAGVGTSVAVSLSDGAWEKWKGVAGETIPRDAMRKLAAGTAAVHSTEAGAAYFSARRGKLDHPGRWALSTFVWGFPVLRRLRTQRKALAEG
jgi:Domain of unknown function (DUF4499)